MSNHMILITHFTNNHYNTWLTLYIHIPSLKILFVVRAIQEILEERVSDRILWRRLRSELNRRLSLISFGFLSANLTFKRQNLALNTKGEIIITANPGVDLRQAQNAENGPDTSRGNVCSANNKSSKCWWHRWGFGCTESIQSWLLNFILERSDEPEDEFGASEDVADPLVPLVWSVDDIEAMGIFDFKYYID